MKFILTSFLFFSIILKGSEVKPPETVSYVDLKRYSGTWYEIARFPFKQQEGCFNTTATYELNVDGTVKVTNRCRKGSSEGPESVANAKAKIVDSVSNAKLKVKFFFLAPWAPYWIIRLAGDYNYAVVSQPDRKYLWILSRTPQMSENLYNEILDSLKVEQFDISRLVKTPQSWNKP